jgi:diguanylate cyclase (GGDEF)-like protein/PAS domain S-box-containing protein
MNTTGFEALSQYIDLLLDAICVVDKAGRFEFVSAGAERIFGYTPQEMLGRQMLELVHPEDRARTIQAANDINAGALKVDFKNRYIRKDGQVVHLLWSARWSAADQRRVAVARDITTSQLAKQRQEALYAISQASFSSEDLLELYHSIHQIVANLMPLQRFAIMLQDNVDELSFAYDASDNALLSVLSEDSFSQLCQHVIDHAKTILITQDNYKEQPPGVRSLVKDKNLNWLGVALKSHTAVIGALVLENNAGNVVYASAEVEVLEFVSVQVAVAIERKQMLQRLQRSALYDHLTQLPNRELFYDRFRIALLRAQREQTQFALLYLDLNNFKQINDQYGHQFGDALLQQCAQRILSCLRQSDTVARFGGDEFVVLLHQTTTENWAMQLAEKICKVLNQPFQLSGQLVQIAASIGIASYPQHGHSRDTLLSRADSAMYAAKKAGGNRVVCSDSNVAKP